VVRISPVREQNQVIRPCGEDGEKRQQSESGNAH
jgi:hypothetical protein